MTEEKLPVAVWSGEILGMKVHVLDDGRRIIDAEDLTQFFEELEEDGESDFDAYDFALEYRAFMNGTHSDMPADLPASPAPERTTDTSSDTKGLGK